MCNHYSKHFLRRQKALTQLLLSGCINFNTDGFTLPASELHLAGYLSQLPLAATSRSYLSQLPLAATSHSYLSQLPLAATSRSYLSQLPLAATSRSYLSQLPLTATSRSYLSQLPLTATSRSYLSQLPLAATSNSYLSQLPLTHIGRFPMKFTEWLFFLQLLYISMHKLPMQDTNIPMTY